MKIMFLDNGGAGFADFVEVAEGTTVAQFPADRLPDQRAEDLLIRLNRGPTTRDYVLQEGSSMSSRIRCPLPPKYACIGYRGETELTTRSWASPTKSVAATATWPTAWRLSAMSNDQHHSEIIEPSPDVRLGSTEAPAPALTTLQVRGLAHTQAEILRVIAKAIVSRSAGHSRRRR